MLSFFLKSVSIKSIMLNFIVLSVVMLIVIMLNIVAHSVSLLGEMIGKCLGLHLQNVFQTFHSNCTGGGALEQE
jgi:hypothetical protein